jgi:hypothetical protein
MIYFISMAMMQKSYRDWDDIGIHLAEYKK